VHPFPWFLLHYLKLTDLQSAIISLTVKREMIVFLNLTDMLTTLISANDMCGGIQKVQCVVCSQNEAALKLLPISFYRKLK